MSVIPVPSHGLSVEDMLDRLSDDGVSVTMFGPKFFGPGNTNWHIELKKSDGGVKLELHENDLPLKEGISAIYDKWHLMMDGKIRQHLGIPQIEHRVETPPMTPAPKIYSNAAEAEAADRNERFGGELSEKPFFKRGNEDDEIPF